MKRMSNIISQQKRKEIRFIAVVFALTLASIILSATAWAGDVSHFSGNSAIANFFHVDPSGCDCNVNPNCIFTSVFVFAADNKFQNPPHSGSASSGADSFIIKSNCTDILLVTCCFPSAPLADQDWQVSANLKSARLITTLECSDCTSGNPFFNVDVDLKWTAIGDILRGNSHTHTSIPGCIMNSNSSGRITPTMESGTVSDGITNFTPDPSIPDSGDNITSGKSSQVLIGCQ